MLHPVDFLTYIRRTRHKRGLLARIALNIVHDADAYAVDLSEFDKLFDTDRAMVMGLLCWAGSVSRAERGGSHEMIAALIALARESAPEQRAVTLASAMPGDASNVVRLRPFADVASRE